MSRRASIVVKDEVADEALLNPTQIQEILELARVGDIAALENRPNLSALFKRTDDVPGKRALLLAAENGHSSTVDLLLRNGANVNGFENERRTSLWWASTTGSIDTVKILIDNGADLDQPDFNGVTPLSSASRTGKEDVVQLLLVTGSDTQIPDNLGMTALTAASMFGNRNVVELLIRHTKSVDVPNIHLDETSASQPGTTTDSLTNVERLKNTVEDETSGDEGGNKSQKTVSDEASKQIRKVQFHVEGEETSEDSTLPASPKRTQEETGIDHQDSEGRTPLFYAVEYGYDEIVEMLIAAGASSNCPDKENNTPLLFACRSGHGKIVKLILERKDRDVDLRENFLYRTILHVASAEGHEDVVLDLLLAGADVNAQDILGFTALMWASKHGFEKVVKVLLAQRNIVLHTSDSIEGMTAFLWAVSSGSCEAVRHLVAAGADIDVRDERGRNAIILASKCGHAETINYLCKLDVIQLDDNDRDVLDSSLSSATMVGNTEVMKALLNNGFDPNFADHFSRTAMYWAAKRATKTENLDAVSVLLEKGAYVLNSNETTGAVLSMVAHIGHVTTIEVLLSKALEQDPESKASLSFAIEDALRTASRERNIGVADLILKNTKYLHAKDHEGRTLLSWASEMGHQEVVRLLLSMNLDPHSVDINYRNPLSFAASGGHVAVVKTLLDSHLIEPLEHSVETGSVASMTKIHLISISEEAAQDIDIVEKTYPGTQLLIEKVNSPINEVRGLEPRPSMDVTQLELRDKDEQTPLSWAVKCGHGNVVRLLLDRKANINVRNVDGKELWSIVDEELERREHGDVQVTGQLQEVREILDSHRTDGRLLDAPLEENTEADEVFIANVTRFSSSTFHTMSCKRYSVLELLEDATIGDSMEGQEYSCKWIHLPANNMRWVEIIMANHFESASDSGKHNTVLQKELGTGVQHHAPEKLHHARFMRPICKPLPLRGVQHHRSSEDEDDRVSSPQKGFVLFMPYLHWELQEEYESMKATIESIGKESRIRPNQTDLHATQKLLWAYLENPHPLHIRRTLDQYYYHTLKDTTARDNSQTITRYYTKLESSQMSTDTRKIDKIITMVDQLWLWVLPGTENSPPTVLTSFPREGNRTDNQATTLLISNIISACRRMSVRTADDLANIIASECSNIYFDNMNNRSQEMQFLEIYTTSIGDIADSETKCFNRFQHALEKQHFEGSSLTIVEEIKLLQEVKDIKDELNIMSSVFHNQKKILKIMESITQDHHRHRSTGGDGDGNARPLDIVAHNISEVEALYKFADRAYNAINQLMDLKQKQANLLEAEKSVQHTKASVELTLATNRQGNIIMFFTIVTIIFMPLSFMSAFFAINIDEFPWKEDRIPLEFVSRYMFLISALIIAPALIIAFNIQRIAKLHMSHLIAKALCCLRSRKGVQHHDERTDVVEKTVSRRKKRADDEEKGSHGS